MGGSMAQQQAARDELRAHILDAVRERELGGVASGDAVAGVLHDLGSPEDVGKRLRASRSTAALRRPLVQPEGALVIGRSAGHQHLPRRALLAALGCAAATAAAMSVLYAWPG